MFATVRGSECDTRGGRWLLSPARLPIPPRRRFRPRIYKTVYEAQSRSSPLFCAFTLRQQAVGSQSTSNNRILSDQTIIRQSDCMLLQIQPNFHHTLHRKSKALSAAPWTKMSGGPGSARRSPYRVTSSDTRWRHERCTVSYRGAAVLTHSALERDVIR